jgi:hypothetical protein
MVQNLVHRSDVLNWTKRGLLITAPSGLPWASSHAALPAVEALDERRIGVYHSPRDDRGRAHIARASVELAQAGTLKLSTYDSEPVLRPGPLGAFDDSGVTMSCVVEGDDATHLYYTGWTLGVSVPFYFYAGLAIRPLGQRCFQRVSHAPILERDALDPYLTASPWVLHEGGRWRMWYVSCTGWEMHEQEPRHYYHIRYAESADGIHWQREGKVAIDFIDEREYAISRPCVIHDRDCYRMWFAARGERYLMGYAESSDGFSWERDDRRAGIEPSPSGWDSEMVAYPAIFDLGQERYLLYNGNGYGRSGIGYATQAALI